MSVDWLRFTQHLFALFCSFVTFSQASLFAETLDHTEFYVRLYKSNHKNSEILVELQRAEGDSFNYSKYARAILASARGEEVNEESAMRRRSSSLTFIPASVSCHKKEVEKCCQHEDLVPSVGHVEELIKKDRMDAVLLGMDSLLLLTDCERSQVSQSAAEAVLRGNENGQCIIKDFIHNLINCLPSRDTSSSREENWHDFESRQQEIMHNNALAVLGNSLKAAMSAQCPKLCSLVGSDEWMGDAGIVDVLMSELSQAKDRSHDAYQAARCLNILLEISPEAKMKLVERGLTNTMKATQSVGRSRHSLLARECDAALASLADR